MSVNHDHTQSKAPAKPIQSEPTPTIKSSWFAGLPSDDRMGSYLLHICHVLNFCFSARIFWVFKEHGLGVNLLLDPPFSMLLISAIFFNLIRWHVKLNQYKYSGVQSFTKENFEQRLKEVYSIMYGVFPYFLRIFQSKKIVDSHIAESIEIAKSSTQQEKIVTTALKMKNLIRMNFILMFISFGNLYFVGVVGYLAFLKQHWLLMGMFFMQIAGFALNSCTTCLYFLFNSKQMEKK